MMHYEKHTVLKMLLLMMALFLVNDFANAQGTWVQKASFGGGARSTAVGFSIGTKGYIGTGFDAAGVKQDFWEWDQATNIWTQKANFGGGLRREAVGFSIGTKGYIGVGLDVSFKQGDFWEWDQASNVWTKKANFGGTSRNGAVGFSIATKGYIGVGSDGFTPPPIDFWEWDQTTNATWAQKANFGGTGRTGAVGFSISTKGYIGTGAGKQDFWEWDQISNVWTQKANFGGTGRSNAVGFSISTKGYIGTGGGKQDFWEWDQASNVWTQKANFGGTGRGAAVGFSIGTKGYIGTGSLQQDFWEWDQLCDGFSASISSQSNVSCNGGGNGTATVSTNGGTPPFSYNWSNGQTTATAINLTAGNYTVTVTDATGCPPTASVSITQPTAITATPSGTNVSCNGGSNGTASVSVIGGTPSYTFLWSNSATTSSISGLSAGTYTVTVTDANSCTKIAFYTVTQPTVLTAFTTVATCGGSATVIASGGTATYSFIWSNGGTSATQNNLFPGIYNVTATDNKGCTATASATIIVAVLSATTSTTSVSCFGGNNGTATVTPSGGTLPYTYNWQGGGTAATKTNLSAGIYSVTVTDNNGCIKIASATVSQPAVLAASASVCCSGGSATVTPTGGTAPYSYNWSNGATTATSNTLTLGTFFITVTDNNGCTTTTSVTVDIPPPVGTTGPTGATGLTGATGPTGFLQNGTTAGNTPYWNSTQWIVNSSNVFNNGGNVGIGPSFTPSNLPKQTLDVAGKVRVGTMNDDISGTGKIVLSDPVTGELLTKPFGASNASRSDIRYKQNISNIPNALTMINQLRGVYFYWDTVGYPLMHFDAGKQIGFIAQEFLPVVPEVVRLNKDSFYLLDYERTVPLLWQGVKELDSIVNNNSNIALSSSVDSLKQQLAVITQQLASIQTCINNLPPGIGCKGKTKSNNNNDPNNSFIKQYNIALQMDFVVLDQNNPNPFKESTIINYFIPDYINFAQIVFSDNYGRIINSIDINHTGQGQINVKAEKLSTGMYSYNIIIDGKVVDTKKMVKVK